MLIKCIWMLCVCVLLMSCDSRHDRANNYVVSAKALYKKGDLESAKIQFNNALSSEPDRVDALYGLAIIIAEEKKWPQYYNFLQRIIELDPQHTDALLRLSTLHIASGQIDEAIYLSDRLTLIAEDDARTWVLMATISVQLNNTDSAKKHVNTALSLSPNDTEALLLMSNIYMAEGEYKKALETLNIGIRTDTKNSFFYAVKIRALNEMRFFDETIDVFKDLIKLDPKNPAIYHVLSKHYVKLGDVDLARATLVDFANKYPSNSSVLNVASFYETHNTYKETELLIKNYIKEYPDIFSLNFYLSDFYLRNNNYDKARIALKQAIELAPSITEKLLAKNQWAIFEFSQLNLSEVSIIVDSVLLEDPHNIRAITTKARVALSHNKTEQAIRLLRSALSHNNEHPFVLYLLAQAHERQGMNELAKNHYQRALVLSDYNADFSLGYSQFLIDMSRLSQAETVLEKTPIDNDKGLVILELLAEVKLKLAKWSDAEKVALKIKEMQGDNYKTDYIMGMVYSSNNQITKSIDSFQSAYSQSTDNFRPLSSLIDTYLKAGQAKQAHVFLQKILKSHPNNLYAHLLLARVYIFTQNLDKAEAIYQRSIELHSHHQEPYIGLYHFYSHQKEDNVKAEKILEQAYKKLPKNLDITVKLATIKQRRNDFLGAIEMYEAWYDKNNQSPIINNNLASLLLKSNDPSDWQRALVLAKSLSSSSIAHFLDTLGWAYYLNGQIQASIRYLDQASKALSGVPEFDYHFAVALLAQSDTQRGITLLDKAIANADDDAPWLAHAKLSREKIH